MWDKINDSSYFMKFVKGENFIEVFVSDFVEIFKVKLLEEQFLQEIKDSNLQLLEIDDSVLLENVEQMLQNPTKYAQTVCVSRLPGGNITMNVTRSLGFPLRVMLSLSKQSEQNFFSHVTAPLLRVIYDLKHNQEALCKLLVQKDNEINEYREEGARLYYEHIKRLNALFRTPKFNYEEYKAQNSPLRQLFKDDDILNSVLNKIIEEENHSSSHLSGGHHSSQKPKQEVNSMSENANSNGKQIEIESVGSTSMVGLQNVKEELKDAKMSFKREPTDPVSNDNLSTIGENTCNSFLKKKQKKLFNL